MPLYLYQSVWGGAFLLNVTLQFRQIIDRQAVHGMSAKRGGLAVSLGRPRGTDRAHGERHRGSRLASPHSRSRTA